MGSSPSAPADVLVAALKAANCQCCDGENHPDVQASAEECVRLQVESGRSDHVALELRYEKLWGILGTDARLNEACATGHIMPGNLPETPESAAREIVSSWRQSSGHWEIVSRAHRYFGVAMGVEPASGVWHGVVTVADVG